MKKIFLLSMSLAVAVGGAVASQTADAATVRQNASGMCQGALPAFDTQIRKRPLAVRNEGTESAFVTCSLAGASGVPHNFAQLVFTNSSDAAVTVNCTVVTGRAAFAGPPVYYPLSVELAAGETDSISIDFDNAVDEANLVNSSCLLPAGVELDYVRIDSVEV